MDLWGIIFQSMFFQYYYQDISAHDKGVGQKKSVFTVYNDCPCKKVYGR